MLARTQNRTVEQTLEMIERPAGLLRAEAALQERIAERKAKHDELIATIAKNGDHRHDAKVTTLDAEEKALHHLVIAAKEAAAPHRARYAQSVADALAPVRRDVGSRIADLLISLASDLEELERSRVAIEQAGGQCIRVPVPWIDELCAIARRIADSGK